MNLNPWRSRWMKRLFCRLGVHGPDFFGHGAGVSSPRNLSLAPGHRRCTHCGTEWVAYEAVSNLPYRVLAWERFVPRKRDHAHRPARR